MNLLLDRTGIFELIIECTKVQFSPFLGLNRIIFEVTVEVFVSLPNSVDSLEHVDTVTLLFPVPIKLLLLVWVHLWWSESIGVRHPRFLRSWIFMRSLGSVVVLVNWPVRGARSPCLESHRRLSLGYWAFVWLGQIRRLIAVLMLNWLVGPHMLSSQLRLRIVSTESSSSWSLRLIPSLIWCNACWLFG